MEHESDQPQAEVGIEARCEGRSENSSHAGTAGKVGVAAGRPQGEIAAPVYATGQNTYFGKSWRRYRGLRGVHDATWLGLGAVRLGRCCGSSPVKLLAYRVFDPTAAPLLVKQSVDVTPQIAKRAYELYGQQGPRIRIGSRFADGRAKATPMRSWAP